MVCPKCGKIVPDEAKFCRYCGILIDYDSHKSVDKISNENLNNESSINQNVSTEKTSLKQSDISFKGYIIICMIALAIAFALMYLRNINNISFDKDELKTYTCIGSSSQLLIKTPFDLKDENLPLDETVKHMVYKIGVSGNFSIEVVGIIYDIDISRFRNSDIMFNLIELLEDEKDIENINKGDLANTIINGNNCARQTIRYYDRINKLNIESTLVALNKNNEVWVIIVAYKKGDQKAKDFAEHIINNLNVL